MGHLRKYGDKPFRVAVIHGGPGAPGEMAPVARELGTHMGVLEPLQTAATIAGQVKELKTVLQKSADLPVTLVGFSWGAWLIFIFAARHLSLVKKLILVASAPFEDRYAIDIMKTRLARLTDAEKQEAASLMDTLDSPSTADKNVPMARLGELMAKADSFDRFPRDNTAINCQYDIYQAVWEEARKLRSSGQLLNLGKRIRCPVVAIHGDYDPHFYQGVREPLSRILRYFRFILLEQCGHYPWLERNARDSFYSLLKREVS